MRAAGLALVTAGTVLVASAPASNAVAAGPTEDVMVFLHDTSALRAVTPSALAERRTATARAQAPALAAVARAGGTVRHRYSLVDGFAATVPPGEAAALAARPDVAAVLPDAYHRLPARPVAAAVKRPAGPTTTAAAAPAAPQQLPMHGTSVCPADPTHPQLEPEALQTMRVADDDAAVPQARSLATGRGVRIGVIAGVIDPDSPDLLRADGSRVVSDYRDVVGTGTRAPGESLEGMGDVASVAAQGRVTYDLGDWSPYTPKNCTIRVRGVAPDASVDEMKVFDVDGFTDGSVVAGIDDAVMTDHVDVLNESFGADLYPDDGAAPIDLANAAAVAAGVTVVAASGDAGPGNTVASPADQSLAARGVLAVGASTQLRSLLQQGYFRAGRHYWSGAVADLSSSGVAQTGRTLDVLAPGYEGWSLCALPTTRYLDCPQTTGRARGLTTFAGTSESAPLTAGVAALVIQRYRDTHGGASPAPALVKQLITSTADDIGVPAELQGSGQVDALRAVRLAGQVAAPAPGRTDLVVTPTQVTLAGTQGSPRTVPLTLADPGSAPRPVEVAVRTSRPVSTQVVPLHFPSGTYSDEETFTVAPGTDRVEAAVSWPDPTRSSGVFMDLFDPNGDVANDGITEGASNSEHLEADHPLPGTWTLFVSAPGTSPTATAVVTSSRNETVGVPQHVTVPGGGSTTVAVTVPAPQAAGDRTYAVTVADAGSDAGSGRVLTSVPVVVRDVLALQDGAATFRGSLSGGNGRSGLLGGFDEVSVDVPAGAPALHVGLVFPGGTRQKVAGTLVAPSGQALDRQSSLPPGSTDPNDGGRELDLYATAPAAGRWTVLFGIDGAIAGNRPSFPYTGTVSTAAPQVTSTGLPAGGTVAAGSTATVHIVNDTYGTHAYVLDPRLRTRSVQVLRGTRSLTLTRAGEANGTTSVPPLSDLVTSSMTASRPLLGEIAARDVTTYGFSSSPAVLAASPVGRVVVGTSAPQLVDGPWLLEPGLIGPFPPGGGPRSVPVAITTVVRTRTPDLATTSTTGDPWRGTLAGVPGGTVTPLVLGPGASADVTVTVAAAGAPGAVVRGDLVVEDWDPAFGVAGEVAALPYSYTVG